MKIEDIHCVLIIGAGTMGKQIGLQSAMHAYDVILYDSVPEALQSASAQIMPPLWSTKTAYPETTQMQL